jgi:glutamate-1-semialdehyde aminotransferase
MAKSLGGGFPIGAFWVRAPFADLLGPGTHGTTFGGTPLACAVALKILEVIEKEKLADNARKLGDWMKTNWSGSRKLIRPWSKTRAASASCSVWNWRKKSRVRRERQIGGDSIHKSVARGGRFGDSGRNASHPPAAAAEFETAGSGRRHFQNRGSGQIARVNFMTPAAHLRLNICPKHDSGFAET